MPIAEKGSLLGYRNREGGPPDVLGTPDPYDDTLTVSVTSGFCAWGPLYFD